MKTLAAARTSGSRKRQRKDMTPLEQLQKLKVLAQVPMDSITQQQASRITPPGGHIWNGWKHGAWHCHLPPYARFHAPWSVHGHHPAVLLCLRTMWEWWLEDAGLPWSACPVAGLFE